jgi:hypothetical protein
MGGGHAMYFGLSALKVYTKVCEAFPCQHEEGQDIYYAFMRKA